MTMSINYQKALNDADKARAYAKNGTVKYQGTPYKLIFDRKRGGYDLLVKDEIHHLTAFKISIARRDAIYWLSN